MGGVINSVLKSGSNEFHGSVFSYWAPYWMAKDPTPITTVGRSLGYVRMPDYDTSIGAEVGGPIIKDRLFFWAGFAPRFENSHVFRQTYVQHYDPTTMGAATDAAGNPIQVENTYWRARIPESRQTYYYAATLDWIPRPEHHLTLAAMGSPNFNEQMRSFNNVEFISNPSWAQEKLTKSNSDFAAHWTSKLYDNHWRIDAPRRHPHRISLRPLAERRAQRAQPARLLRRQPVGPRTRARLRADRDLPALPRRRLPHGRLRPDPQVQRRPLDGRPQVDPPVRGRRPPRPGLRLAPGVRDVRPGALVFGPARARAASPRSTRSRLGRDFNSFSFFTLQPGEQPSDFGQAGSGCATRPPTCCTRPATRTASRRTSRAGSTRSSSRRTSARRGCAT